MLFLFLLQQQLAGGAERLPARLVLLDHRARPLEIPRELIDLVAVAGQPHEPVAKRTLVAASDPCTPRTFLTS